LVEEFKRGMNRGIRRKLMEVENLPVSIEQWYKRATALDRNWRESRREEERLREKKEMTGGAPKQEQRQNLPRPLVWQRRQMPQQVTMGPAPMEGIERTNTVVVRGSGVGAGQNVGVPPRRDPYAMEIDRGRNCYACGGFGHMARHCRNRGRGRPMEGRRVEYMRGRIEEIYNNTNNLKRERESRTPQLDSQNKYSVLATMINADTPASEEKVRKVEGRTLREVTVKIGLERIDTQEEVTVEALLDSGATGLVMSSEFARKQSFKLKKLERLMNVRNVDGSLNKEGPIENMVEVNIYYKGHRERTKIDVIGGQK